MVINMNDRIKVRLNDRGRDIWYHQYDEIAKEYPKCGIRPSYPKTDENGYTDMQLWVFMELYGPYTHMCMDSYLDSLNIVVVEDV